LGLVSGHVTRTLC